MNLNLLQNVKKLILLTYNFRWGSNEIRVSSNIIASFAIIYCFCKNIEIKFVSENFS